jgi:cytochrome b6
MALFLFAVQIITGTLLSLYYKPSPDQAFESVRALMTEVPFGWLFRSVHSWSANLLIGVLLLHLLTTFMMRAYRNPREFTWITGVLLFAIFMAFGFSGYLLPWNKLAFSATRVGTAIAGAVPLVGNHFLLLARSGENVTGDTLARFYSLHVVILPLATFALLGIHLFLVQKHGMSVPDSVVRRHGTAEEVPSMPFVPHFLLRDMVGWYIAVALLAALAACFPWELGEKADPFGAAPKGIMPEWYFLFMFYTLEQLPGTLFGTTWLEGKVAALLFFGFCGLVVLVVPFLDRRTVREVARRVLSFLATWAVFAFILQTALGLFDKPGAEAGEEPQTWQTCLTLLESVAYSGLATVAAWALWIGFCRARARRVPGGSWLGILAAILLLSAFGVAGAWEKADAKSASAEAAGKVAAKPVPDAENSCTLCHAELTEPDQKRFLVTVKDMAGDIHWQKGLRCQDCHGGDPTILEIKAHFGHEDFRAVKSPADVPELCGRCHSSVEYMRRYQPSPRTDQLSEYWTSGHGRKLKATGDPAVATCVSCHGKPHGSAADPAKQGILPLADLNSPVYRTRLAKTCAKCHSDEKMMVGRAYRGQPLGHRQHDEWLQSVHGKALLEKGDLSAPTCNNCHGNHGAVPPQVDSVANACGSCHGRAAKLFADTQMKHAFEKVGLPGCSACHNNHLIRIPSDEMLGMQDGTVCNQCHDETKPGKYGATVAGAEKAKALRGGLDSLQAEIEKARKTIDQADHLGMEISKPRYDLRKATDALKNARVQIHSFDPVPVEKILADGHEVASQVQSEADTAVYEYHARRVWLAASLVPILAVVVLLVLYIRTLPRPE